MFRWPRKKLRKEAPQTHSPTFPITPEEHRFDMAVSEKVGEIRTLNLMMDRITKRLERHNEGGYNERSKENHKKTNY